MDHQFLFAVFILLAGASIIVPVTGRLKLGLVLGYLFVGSLLANSNILRVF